MSDLKDLTREMWRKAANKYNKTFNSQNYKNSDPAFSDYKRYRLNKLPRAVQPQESQEPQIRDEDIRDEEIRDEEIRHEEDNAQTQIPSLRGNLQWNQVKPMKRNYGGKKSRKGRRSKRSRKTRRRSRKTRRR